MCLWGPAYAAPSSLAALSYSTVDSWFSRTPSMLWEAHCLSAPHLILHHPPLLYGGSHTYRCAESCREYFFLFWKLHFGSSNLNNWAQGTVALHRTQHLSYRNIETVDRELGELASCVFVCVCVWSGGTVPESSFPFLSRRPATNSEGGREGRHVQTRLGKSQAPAQHCLHLSNCLLARHWCEISGESQTLRFLWASAFRCLNSRDTECRLLQQSADKSPGWWCLQHSLPQMTLSSVRVCLGVKMLLRPLL